jgi:hypothetical protein
VVIPCEHWTQFRYRHSAICPDPSPVPSFSPVAVTHNLTQAVVELNAKLMVRIKALKSKVPSATLLYLLFLSLLSFLQL